MLLSFVVRRPALAQLGNIYIGTAGWSIPASSAAAFPAAGTHLQRYAARLACAEINSSFYRPHRPQTYAKWAAAVPDEFRFAVKLPKTITHGCRLRDAEDLVRRFLAEVAGLETQLGVLLVQLPPSLAFDAETAEAFFAALRAETAAGIACEPRHPSWFAPPVGDLLARHRIARVAADPARVPLAAEPGGWPGLVYYRWHGSPRVYYSAYPEEYLASLTAKLQNAAARGAEAWCIFDNTAAGAATGNALSLRHYME